MAGRLFSTLRHRLRIDRRGTAVFLGIALAVGVVVGLAAAGLIGAIEGLSRLVDGAGDLVGSRRVAVMVAVPLGFLLAWVVAHRFAPEVAGDGVPEATAALSIRSGYLPTRSAPLKLVATAFTLGPGGSGGREGPIVQIGASIGSSISRHTGFGEDRVRSLVAAGAGAAIGASFNAPIAGMLFAMEVILGHFAIRHLNAVVVSSVAAAVTTRSIVGDEQILRAIPHQVRDPRELVLYALLGVLAAFVGVVFLRLLAAAETRAAPGPVWLRPVLLGLGVAAIGWFEPDILGTGQSEVARLIDLLGTDAVVWWSLLALAGWKVIATTLTLGAHASGGAFMPSLFIGAALGAGVADLASTVWTASSLSPGAFAVVGMAATFAAVARAPLTSILIVFEITGDYGLVLPLMLAASLATFMADRVHPDSVYQAVLARRGIRLTRRSEVDVLDTVRVGDVASPASVVVPSDATTGEVQGLLDRTRHHGVPVVDDGRLVGVITVTDIVRSGGPSDQVTAAEAMTPRPVTATPSTTVSEVLERMAALGVGRIPVVGDEDPSRLVGVFRREDAVTAYHVALGREVHHDLGRDRLRTRIAPGAGFFDVEVPAGSVAAGALVRELSIPGGCTIVSVRRGMGVIVPDGSTRLAPGDVLTVFAREGSKEQFEHRLSLGDTGEVAVVSGDDPARFYDLEIPPGSLADGRLIKEVPVPGGCTIVSVRRRGEVIVPDGNTRLAAGDVLTVFARREPRTQFAERLRSGSAPE